MEKHLTFKRARDLFFDIFPEFEHERRTRKSHNDYSTDCRTCFCDFVDNLERAGMISERAAQRITLG